jgi:hypothetical protein
MLVYKCMSKRREWYEVEANDLIKKQTTQNKKKK